MISALIFLLSLTTEEVFACLVKFLLFFLPIPFPPIFSSLYSYFTSHSFYILTTHTQTRCAMFVFNLLSDDSLFPIFFLFLLLLLLHTKQFGVLLTV